MLARTLQIPCRDFTAHQLCTCVQNSHMLLWSLLAVPRRPLHAATDDQARMVTPQARGGAKHAHCYANAELASVAVLLAKLRYYDMVV